MFTISVQDEFCAAHALTIAGSPEPVHGHNFRVVLTLEGPELDSDGLLCDFHTIEASLNKLLDPFRNADLARCPPFDSINPSAECIARFIAQAMHERVGASLAPHARIASVSVTEAPGCCATYHAPLLKTAPSP